jgi:hypothetical protein
MLLAKPRFRSKVTLMSGRWQGWAQGREARFSARMKVVRARNSKGIEFKI